MNDEIKKFLDTVDAHPEWNKIELSQSFIEEVRALLQEYEGLGVTVRNCYMIIDRKEKLNKHYRAEIERYENALDKACSKITLLCDDYESYESIMDVDDWKEWALSEYD